MYRAPVIMGKISPDSKTYRTPTHSGGDLLRPEGAYFSIMTSDVLNFIPLITRLLARCVGRVMVPYAKMPIFYASNTRNAFSVAVP